MEKLTADDVEILKLSVDDANIFLDYYFGVTLFPHQLVMVHAKQNNQLLLGGRGSGKTYGFAWGYIYLLVMIPDFRVMWGSYSADQAAIPFTEILQPVIAESERFQKFLPEGLRSLKRKPFPAIHVKIPGTKLPPSNMVFKTIGIDARTKRGFTLDAIHYDEGGLEPNPRVITSLRPAMRGRRLSGEPRMGRFSVSTTPTAVDWLRHWWRCAQDKEYQEYAPDKYVAIRVSSEANQSLTGEQLEAFRLDMTEEEIQVEIQGEFPEYLGTDFAPSVVNGCQDDALNDEMDEMLRSERLGAERIMQGRLGVVRYVKPFVKGRRYLLSGDPGTGNPPFRNAPCLMCFDVSELPYELVCLEWISGNGSYKPFFNRYEWALGYYRPVFAVFDSTGTQKAMEELYFEDRGLMVEGLSVTTDKAGMINSARILMQRGGLRIPYIAGLRIQLLSYRMDNDTKLAQDLVMTLAMATWKMRIFSFNDNGKEEPAAVVDESFLQGMRTLRTGSRIASRVPR